MPREYIKTQKAQAILIILAANAVIEGRKDASYWEIERRWIVGEYPIPGVYEFIPGKNTSSSKNPL